MLQPVRVGLGWLDKQEAVRLLHEDRAVGPEESSRLEDALRAAAAQVCARLPGVESFTINPFPRCLSEQARKFRLRNEVGQQLQDMDWDLGVIDLAEVLSFQKMIRWDSTDRLASLSADDWEGLFRLTLPEAPEAEELHIETFFDAPNRATILSSPDLNLCSTSHGSADMVSLSDGGLPKKIRLYGYGVAVRPSILQAVEYRGRLFIRDGYHRSVGLLKYGIRHVPAVVVRAKSLLQVGANAEGFFSEEVIMGDRPMRLRDFLDDTVTATIQRTVFRKVVRIVAEEYIVRI